MLTAASPRFSNGTRFEDLINTETREVSLSLMRPHAELHQLEMERVFGRTWLLLGHESEIPNPGDFMVRDMGEDQVIVARGRDNNVHVSLNVCTHRGMRLCTAEIGRANLFRCIYHGWTFQLNGDFVAAPIERECMHGDVLSKEQLGLRKARVTLYGGLIFATWNIEGPSFEEFLGEMKFYYDMLFCRTDAGLEMLGPPQRFVVNANWKTASEQSAADGYHTLTAHRSLMEMGLLGSGADVDKMLEMAPAMYGVDVGSPHGHALRCIPAELTYKMFAGRDDITGVPTEERLKILPPPGITPDMLPQVKKHMSQGQLDLLARCPPQVGGMFPNVLIAFIYAPAPEGQFSGALTLHTYVPRGPDKLEFVNYIFAERDAPEAMKRDMLANSIQQTGTSGTIEQDDSDMWPHMTRNARGVMGAMQTMKYHALGGRKRPEGWPGGGFVYEGFTKDDTQWNWWSYYRELMLKP